MDRSKSGNVSFHPDFAKLRSLDCEYNINEERIIKLELLIDKTSVEAFFFEGMYAMTNLVYPKHEEQRYIHLFPDDDERLTINKLQITVLNSAFEKTEEVEIDPLFFY